jgi:quaternary ammonium compound-resistance protein SugE
MAWAILFLAGFFEICWTLCLKQSDGFSRLTPSLLTIAFSVASLGCLGLALKTLPMGTAYAVWTGTGAAGIALLGLLYFGEPATFLRLSAIGLIVTGVVALRLTG